jgi:dTDP-4-amino-4,6-dideoxygalactose transaminase
MPAWKVPLADVDVRESDIEAVAATYRSGWLSMGPETEALEHAFAGYTGAPHAVAVTNGTAALHLAMAAAGLGPGDEVIVPSLTFVATVNAVTYTGARPVFAEIAGLETPWLSAAACDALISGRTAAIVHMAYGGHHGELEQLEALARRKQLMLF